MKLVRNERLEDSKSTEVFFETINNDFLAAFYQDTKRFSFAFQMYMLTTRLYQMEEACRQAQREDRSLLYCDQLDYYFFTGWCCWTEGRWAIPCSLC
jgi:deoxyadenosine/deoxycytidine kinase